MPKHSPLDIKYECLLLKKEEARLAAALSTVRSQLNDLLPIFSLPPEILEEIFEICVSWLYSCQKPKHRLAWTQVCSSWRRISLNSSRLWRRIDLCDARFAHEFLVRSKQAPLSIVTSSPLKMTTDDLARHAGRLKSIDLFLFPDDLAHLFESIGPNLSTLDSLSLKIPPVSSPLSLTLSFPNIRRLILDCVAIKWQSCANLTHLSLRGLTSEFCPSIAELHGLLERSPYLEYLRLESLLPLAGEAVTRRPISLVHLREMIVSGQPSVVGSLLQGLYLSPQTRLSLFAPLSDGLHTMLPDGLPFLNAIDVDTLRLSRHSAHFLRYRAEAWSEDATKILFSISSSRPLANGVCNSLARLPQLNLARMTKLELNTGVITDLPQKALDSLFADLCDVEELCVAFNDLGDLLRVLQTLQPATAQVYLPRLRRLSFSRPADLWWQFSENWLPSIIECLQTRLRFQPPVTGPHIEWLQFYRCGGMSETCLKVLENLVDRVESFDAIPLRVRN
ncbi:hypothetical protein D9619_012174 [Psilocybe cf. subviscida]|uniref:F-box domain-containing protein n=1 Tax=Psilocybe cf. subviscida TaxID=2480587 RepID=A0A8H5EZF9_9AGAR|nr:hypothetical protein D9619_012174 [Psilocybe cf. subviscida]